MEMAKWPVMWGTALGTHQTAMEHDYLPIPLQSPSLSFAFLLEALPNV